MTKSALFLGASAAVLLFAASSTAFAGSAKAPAPVPSATTGRLADAFVGISIGQARLDADGATGYVSGLTVEGTGSGEYNITPSLGVQGDVVYRTQTWNSSTTPSPSTQLGLHDFEAALHGFTRSEQYLLGVFGQYGEGYLGAGGGVIGADFTHVFGGVEGQVFLGDATLYAQAGAKRYNYGNQASSTGYFGTFEARYYLQPNFKVEAHIAYETLDDALSTSNTVNTVNLGVGAEYRIADTPFSLFGKYDYAKNSLPGGTAWDNRILAGVKFNFDAPTLLDRDRSGASLKPFESHDFDWGGVGLY